MKVAAFQAPITATSSLQQAINVVRDQVAFCAENDIRLLCCPECVLGGLADYACSPSDIALNVESGQLSSMLQSLANDKVAVIVGFTEVDGEGHLFNSAAVYDKGVVTGIYRKLYPAINRSIYEAGSTVPVFTVDELTFGITICNDSNYFEPARIMASIGATAIFVPTNNGLPPSKGGAYLVDLARNCDIARAVENSVYVIRSDVVGSTENLVSFGSTGLICPEGMIMQTARQNCSELLVCDLMTKPRTLRRGWDASKNQAVMTAYAQLVAKQQARDN